MFISNPHPNPIIILAQDMKAKLVSNLLEFIYNGSVRVEQDELQDFMKIAEVLQIKGLTSSSKEIFNKTFAKTEKETEEKSGFKTIKYHRKTNDTIFLVLGSKRQHEPDETTDTVKIKGIKPSIDITDLTEDDDDQFQIIPMPEISIVESRFESNNTTSIDAQHPPSNLKIASTLSLSKFNSYDFQSSPNDMQDSQNKIGNETSESGSGITMLSSTSLLHGNCVFNRNNTVATQSGLKTYWLCKSYRISMCKARCITFKGKVISATGIHNHLAHMSNKPFEIPPGFTPNVFNPSHTSEFSISSALPSSQLLHHTSTQQIQHPYNFLQHQQPETSSAEIGQFKMEHM